MRQSWITILFFLLWSAQTYPIKPIGLIENGFVATYTPSQSDILLEKANGFYAQQQYAQAIEAYLVTLKNKDTPKAFVLKKIALSYAALEDPEQTVFYLEQSLRADFNTRILVDLGFDTIRNTEVFQKLEASYQPNMSALSFLYLYVALIGFYIAVIIHFNNKIDRIAKILISCFLLIHSLFILNIMVNIANYHYIFPHSYLMSTCFSFLYGPLLYFYLQRITQQYQFKKRDLLHLLPTLPLLLYLVPIYFMSAEDKLSMMLQRVSTGLNAADATYMTIIVVLKLASLLVYGYFIRKIYLNAKDRAEMDSTNKSWLRNFYGLHILYIGTYAVYGLLITNQIASGFLYHTQVVSMSLMVLFLGFSATVQPRVFSGLISLKNQLFYKYEKSGLTKSLSNELKENLLHIFDVQKVYKENDLSLESLAERLNTTRHNTSQVINEHFGMNFHELVNKYRIQEAKYILETDRKKSLHIIDVAYEVGFNNKVTFNKAFKKDTHLTPSEYQRVAIRV